MRKLWLVFKKTFTEFFADRAIKLSASLSYYTIFSLGPMLLIIISLVGIFFGKEAVAGEIHTQIEGLVGNAAALQIQDIIGNIEESQMGRQGAVIGFIILFVGATGVFTEMQDSINFIWSIRTKPKTGILKVLLDRVMSFSLIISFGFILMVSLGIHAVVDLMYGKLKHYFSEVTVVAFQVLNYVILFAIITCLFAIIFKILPDAKIRWKDAFVGAIFTAILFLVGKSLIGLYLGNSNIGVTYGTAASVIIILLWVYYTSTILYFGAEFTKVYTMEIGGGIVPKKTAVFIVKKEVEEQIPTAEDIKSMEKRQEQAD